MSSLELEGVSKRAGARESERMVLREVCLTVNEGELAVVWGMRRSGRSTLLRVAAGIESADGGSVRFGGRALEGRGERVLGSGIGYCRKGFDFGEGETALDHAMVGLLARWVSPSRARARASDALKRTGASHCARMRRHELSEGEKVRVALARTLALEPSLVVVDEPVKGVELIDRDGVLSLLRELADEGVAVLASTGESSGLSEADSGYVLAGAQLRGAPAAREENKVVELRLTKPRRAYGG